MQKPAPTRATLPILLAAMLASTPAAAEVSQQELLDLIGRLNARLDAVEKRNAELERRVAGHALAVEARDAAIEKGLASERLSENEPELTARLKGVEIQAANAQKAARVIEALEGISASMSLTTVAQKPLGSATPANSQLGYRGDISVDLPLGNLGNASSKFFAHFRLGQNAGLNILPTYAVPNAAAFPALATRPEDSAPILAQAWLQTDIPLPLGGHAPNSREKLELNFGKIDPFVFFDQNAAANDEARQFLNAAFVHNPLLDAGGDIGVDANGFAPGVRLAYLNHAAQQEPWQLSLGIFGAGPGASYARTFSSPLVIVQAETRQPLFTGDPGNYRIYYWRNGQAADYAGNRAQHAGWGISADQRVDDAITLFGRYGRQRSGLVRFDRALTLGAEIGGSYWNRSGDALGLAAGRLRTSRAFSRDSAGIDADGDGTPDYGFSAGGGERIAELYYRYRINKHIELTPDLQYIATPGGNPAAAALRIAGLRLQLSY